MRLLLLARHAESESNATGTVSSVPPGGGITARGRTQAHGLGEALSEAAIDLGVVTRLRRTRETLELALEGRDVPVAVVPELDEIGYGGFEGGTMAAYREWAWSMPADAPAPGHGESRGEVAARIATGLDRLLDLEEDTVLAVGHALPIRYVLDAARGLVPKPAIDPVENAAAHPLERPDVEAAARLLRDWSRAPVFRDR